MDFTRFDRQENMSGETRTKIMDIISDIPSGNFTLKNSMYGLFDGYLYDDSLERSKKLDKDLQVKIKEVIDEVSKYPKVVYEEC
jgi:hypothetical protein